MIFREKLFARFGQKAYLAMTLSRIWLDLPGEQILCYLPRMGNFNLADKMQKIPRYVALNRIQLPY